MCNVIAEIVEIDKADAYHIQRAKLLGMRVSVLEARPSVSGIGTYAECVCVAHGNSYYFYSCELRVVEVIHG
jgi:hypothetical protein